jgi:transposase-like protein
MSSTRGGLVRRSAQEWAEIVRRFKSSGVELAEFCKSEGVAVSSFHQWRRRLVGQRQRQGFVELASAATKESHDASSWSLELQLPSGIAIRLKG